MPFSLRNFEKHRAVFQAKRRAILFDLDGTLYDSAYVRGHMMLKLVRAYQSRPKQGIRVVQVLQAYRRAHEQLRTIETVGQDLRVLQLQTAADRLGVPVSDVDKHVRRWMEEEPLELLRPAMKIGLLPFLHLLKKANFALGVVSDYPAMEKLRYMGLDHYVDVVVSAQDRHVQSLKPSARSLCVAANALDVLPKHTLYIGDRIGIDDVAAQRAGMGSVIIGAQSSPRPGSSGVPDYFALAAIASDLISSNERSFEPAQ